MENTDAIIGAIGSFDLAAIASQLTFDIALVAIVALIISAFFALRLFKVYISAIGAISFGYIGQYLALMFMDAGMIPVIEGFNLPIIIGLGAALLGFLLAAFLHKVVLFVGGALGGFYVSLIILVPLISGFVPIENPVDLIISGVVAVIVGALLCGLFKPVYIFVTSIGGTAIVGAIISMLVLPFELTTVIIGTVVGAVVGIIPMVYQFKASANE